jgi:hypothetical protein
MGQNEPLVESREGLKAREGVPFNGGLSEV